MLTQVQADFADASAKAVADNTAFVAPTVTLNGKTANGAVATAVVDPTTVTAGQAAYQYIVSNGENNVSSFVYSNGTYYIGWTSVKGWSQVAASGSTLSWASAKPTVTP